MNEMQLFGNSEFGNMRIMADDNNKFWFCGKDAAMALGYKNPSDAVLKLVNSEYKTTYAICISGSNYKSKTVFVNEAGLYQLIFSSKLESASRFQKWVFEEVLPSIRKNGGYIAGQESMNDVQLKQAAQNVAQNVMNERESLLLKLFSKDPLETANAYKRLIEIETAPLIETIEEQKPKVDFADTVMKTPDNIKIGALAKILNNDGINIGEKRLFKLLRDRGVLMKDNVPYQDFIDNGFFLVHEGVFKRNDVERLYTVTLVTPKGQVWIASKIRSWLGVM